MAASNQYYPTLPQLPGTQSPNKPIAGPVMGGGATLPGMATPGQGQSSTGYTVGYPGSPTPSSGSTPTGTGGGASGAVPKTGGFDPSPGQYFNPAASAGYQNTGGTQNMGHGIFAQSSMYPQLSDSFAQFLQSMIGQGASPFNLSAPLPSGGTTNPGQLSAPMNPLMQSLMQLFMGNGQSNVPGANTLANVANNGISAMPEWQSMIDAQGQNIQQNQANLREQFSAMGGLAGSPFGTAMSNFQQQTTKDQNALLGYLNQQNILQGQLPAAQFMMSGAGQMGQFAQQQDQQTIDRMYNEFIRTQPEYNPLLQQMYGLSTTFAPTVQQPSGGGILGGLLPGMMSGLGAGAGAASGGAGLWGSILAGLGAI